MLTITYGAYAREIALDLQLPFGTPTVSGTVHLHRDADPAKTQIDASGADEGRWALTCAYDRPDRAVTIDLTVQGGNGDRVCVAGSLDRQPGAVFGAVGEPLTLWLGGDAYGQWREPQREQAREQAAPEPEATPEPEPDPAPEQAADV